MGLAWFSPVQPPADLASVLACSWTASPNGRHLLVPDACADLLWTSDGNVWLCGPETTAWTFELPIGTTAVGVRFRPGAVSATFPIDTATIVNRRISLASLCGHDVHSAVQQSIRNADTPRARLSVLENFVAGLGVDERHLHFATEVVTQLAAHRRVSQVELAGRVGVAPRQFYRKCTYGFGYGVSVLARMLRFQRFLAVRDVSVMGESAPGRSLVGRWAVAAGYADQAHLARDCRAITGSTPRQFLEHYVPTFPDMSDPFNTGRQFGVSVVV